MMKLFLLKRKKEIQAEIDKVKAMEAKLQSKSEDLKRLVEEAKEEQEKIAKDVKDAREKNFILNIVSAIMTPIVDIAAGFIPTGGASKALGKIGQNVGKSGGNENNANNSNTNAQDTSKKQ